MRSKKGLVVLLILAAFSSPIYAQDTEGKTEKTIESLSPDGQFAFLLTSTPPDEGTVDLIEKKSEKVLLRVVEVNRGWSALWAPDSKRFAVTERVGHAIQGVSVYFRSGDGFSEIELPELSANIPDRLKRNKYFPHWAALNYARAVAWKNDNSLVVQIDTMLDGAGASVSATRTVLLGFDPSGKTRILKSTIKFETDSQ